MTSPSPGFQDRYRDDKSARKVGHDEGDQEEAQDEKPDLLEHWKCQVNGDHQGHDNRGIHNNHVINRHSVAGAVLQTPLSCQASCVPCHMSHVMQFLAALSSS